MCSRRVAGRCSRPTTWKRYPGCNFSKSWKVLTSGLPYHDALVLLNVTGGGRHRRHAARQLIPARPGLQLDQQEIYLDATLDKIANLFR